MNGNRRATLSYSNQNHPPVRRRLTCSLSVCDSEIKLILESNNEVVRNHIRQNLYVLFLEATSVFRMLRTVETEKLTKFVCFRR